MPSQALELLDRAMRYDSLVTFAASGEGTPWRAVFPLRQIPAPDAGYWNGYRNLMVVDPRDFYAQLSISAFSMACWQ